MFLRPFSPQANGPGLREILQPLPVISSSKKMAPAARNSSISLSIPARQVVGAITIQCIEGAVELELPEHTQAMYTDSLVYLDPQVPRGPRALHDASLLVTLSRSPTVVAG